MMLPYGRQNLDETDIQSVVEVLRSDWLTQGPAIQQFETAVAGVCVAKYAVALSSGTAALHLACRALGLGEGDRFWTTPVTFLASANCGLYCGGKVDFVDIDPRTYNMSVEALEAKLKTAKKKKQLPKVVIPVHLTGQPCEMAPVFELSKKYGFKIIEDASHAIGAEYQNTRIGDCRYSDAVVFSFHPVKIITTGEGGMVMCKDAAIAKKIEQLRMHGIVREPAEMQDEPHGGWYYEQLDLGYNYRITDFQSALGMSQLKRMEAFLQRRRELAARYDDLLKKMPLTLPYQHPDANSAWHLYVIRLKLNEISKTHRQVFDELRNAGIGVNVHYIPVHLQPYYKRFGFKAGDFPNAEQYYREAITLPLYPAMTDADQDRVVDALNRALRVG